MNEKIESLPEHHGDSADLSYLLFYSYPLTSFFKIKKKIPADFYFLARIRYISQYGRYNPICPSIWSGKKQPCFGTSLGAGMVNTG